MWTPIVLTSSDGRENQHFNDKAKSFGKSCFNISRSKHFDLENSIFQHISEFSLEKLRE